MSPLSSSSSAMGSTAVQTFSLKCHFAWKSTIKAHKSNSRMLLNQTFDVPNLEAFITFAWQKAFNHAQTANIQPEDRGAMAIGSAFVPQGDANEMTEINQNPSADNSDFAKHYFGFKKDEDRGSKN